MSQIHGTLIAIDQQGVLITGESGSGKSDLALRLIEQGAQLVSDDYVNLLKKGADVVGFPPETIKGLLEVRHLGVLRFQNLSAASIKLVITLKPLDDLERMPEPTFFELETVKIPSLKLYGFEPSAPAKVGLALAHALGHIERIE